MRRVAGPIALALLVTACSQPARITAPPPRPPTSGLCRVGPDGGRPVADRGIGGTGAPVRVADRGIGGTGIVAVITGFASICLGGLEVGIDDATPATVDGAPGAVAGLRAGQLAVVSAAGPPGQLSARKVAVVHEVVGPVQAATPGMLHVAGQSVAVAADVPGLAGVAVGDWVAVSGLRRRDGVIAATRIDRAAAGRVRLRAALVRVGGATLIGGLPVRLPDGDATPAGSNVTATGRLSGATLVVDSIEQDPLAGSLTGVFGPDVSAFYLEGYVSAVPGGYALNQGFLPGTAGDGFAGTERAVVTFRRQPDGTLSPGTIRRLEDPVLSRPGEAAFTPAPTSRTGAPNGPNPPRSGTPADPARGPDPASRGPRRGGAH